MKMERHKIPCLILSICFFMMFSHCISPGASNNPSNQSSRGAVISGPDLRNNPLNKFGTLPSRFQEIDVLDTYGLGKKYDSTTITSAIKKIGSENRAVLNLKAGKWEICDDLHVPSNISLKFQEGALLTINIGTKLIIDGFIIAGKQQIFTGGGRVFFRQYEQDIYPHWWKGSDDEFFTTAIQKALSSGGNTVYFPEGIYEVALKKEDPVKFLSIPSKIRIFGQGEKSIIRLVDTPRTAGEWEANDLFSGKEIEDVEISRITFDSKKFYPNPKETSRLDPFIRGTRAINITNVKNCKIIGCRFEGFTNGSVYISGINITLDENSFYQGSYRTQTIRLDNSKNVMVSNNTFEDNGPHYYMVLGRPYETASTDAIMVGYNVENAKIIGNKITHSSGCGIRVEKSKNVYVVDNIIQNIGQDGIAFYLYSNDCKCIGNSIINWGKIPNLAYIRKQSGKIFNPKEYHNQSPASNQLPKLLSEAPTWELNRYYLQERDEASIPEYNSMDYKNIRAFRGYSGISVTDGSKYIIIEGNKINGNISKARGLFNYASNYGINIGVHSVNPPTSSGNCIVSNNTISGCIDYDIFCPQYVDPISKKGMATPSSISGNICDSSKVKFYYRK